MTIRLGSLLAASVVIAACKGTNGEQGPQGDPGSPGAAVIVSPLDPGGACPFGGVSIQSGTVTAFACSGAPGAPGTSTSAVALAPGTDPACPGGGTRFVTGGVTSYACSVLQNGGCPLGQEPCGGICRRVDIDPANCGACGNACGSRLCVDGLCAKLVFRTSGTWAGGNLGGVAGADAKCQAAATDAGLVGTFKAWISGGSWSDDLGISPSTTFTRSIAPYALVNGAVVTENWSALVGVDSALPSSFLGHAISLDERGRPPMASTAAWTGTDPSGTRVPFRQNCQNQTSGEEWTSTVGEGGYGSVTSVNGGWTSADRLFCNQLASLYCFEQ